jgi:hypothetical protein
MAMAIVLILVCGGAALQILLHGAGRGVQAAGVGMLSSLGGLALVWTVTGSPQPGALIVWFAVACLTGAAWYMVSGISPAKPALAPEGKC